MGIGRLGTSRLLHSQSQHKHRLRRGSSVLVCFAITVQVLFCVHVNRIESLQGLSHHNVRPKVRRDCSRGQTFLYLFILLLVYDVHLGIHPSETWRILLF